jgi:hypothetical protein
VGGKIGFRSDMSKNSMNIEVILVEYSWLMLRNGGVYYGLRRDGLDRCAQLGKCWAEGREREKRLLV